MTFMMTKSNSTQVTSNTNYGGSNGLHHVARKWKRKIRCAGYRGTWKAGARLGASVLSTISCCITMRGSGMVDRCDSTARPPRQFKGRRGQVQPVGPSRVQLKSFFFRNTTRAKSTRASGKTWTFQRHRDRWCLHIHTSILDAFDSEWIKKLMKVWQNDVGRGTRKVDND